MAHFGELPSQAGCAADRSAAPWPESPLVVRLPINDPD
jgi:hypothetical protein